MSSAPFLRALIDALVLRPLLKTMSKWHYDQAGDFIPTDVFRNDPFSPGSIKSSFLHPVVEAFIANAYRIHSLWQLKPDLLEHACVVTKNIYTATFGLTGHVDLEKATREDPKFMEKLGSALREWIKGEVDKSGLSADEILYNPARAVVRLENFLDSSPAKWDEGFNATLSAMLTGAWTAFEVLASDLWEAALNANPKTLCDLAGDQNRISRMAGSMGREKQESKRQKDSQGNSDHLLYLINKVTRGSFNAGEVMGTILKEQFALHKLSGIRKAYSAAFSKHSEKIDEILSDKALDRLNLVRNLLLHEGGIVEESKFLKGAREISWTPPGKIGSLLPVDGELVRELMRLAFQRCIELILAVDEWINHKPQETEPV
jgi:hypothetical protein